MTQRDTARRLVGRHGTTFAEEAGIRVADKPSPLWQLLVLSLLLSARISSGIAVAATRELNKAGYRSPRSMLDASWQDRVDALGRGHYRRYDERTASMLGDCAQLAIEQYGGDLRKLRSGASKPDEIPSLLQEFKGVGPTGAAIYCRKLRSGASKPDEIPSLLQEFKGVGPTGAAIFCREVQGTWTELAPFADDIALKGAKRLGLPESPGRLAALVPETDLPRLVAACVRASRDKSVVVDVLEEA